MPPGDRIPWPSLEFHDPKLVVDGSYQAAAATALVPFTDGQRHEVGVRGWSRDTRGRRLCLLRWNGADIAEHEGWFVYDPARIVPAGGDGPWR